MSTTTTTGETTEGIQLENLEGGGETGGEATGTEETSFGGDDRRDPNASILIIDGSNPDATATTSDALSDMRQGITGMRRSEAGIKKSYTEKKKNFLEKELGIKLNKSIPGSSSAELFNNMKLRMSSNGKETLGVDYKGVKIIIKENNEKNGKMIISEAKTNASTINEFKHYLKKLKKNTLILFRPRWRNSLKKME